MTPSCGSNARGISRITDLTLFCFAWSCLGLQNVPLQLIQQQLLCSFAKLGSLLLPPPVANSVRSTARLITDVPGYLVLVAPSSGDGGPPFQDRCGSVKDEHGANLVKKQPAATAVIQMASI